MEQVPNQNQYVNTETVEKKENKEGLLNNISRKLRKLKLMGIVLGGALLGLAENSSAQTAHEGVAADSIFYHMTEKQLSEVKKISVQIDGLMNTIQEEIKQHKVPVTDLKEFVDGKQISSTLFYNYKNIQVYAGGWDLNALTGDTLKNEPGGSITISDVSQGEQGEVNLLTKQSITFGSDGGDFDIDYYTNSSGEKYGGELLSFEYGDNFRDKMSVFHAKEEHPDTRYLQKFSVESPDAEKESFKKLEHVLVELKHELETAVKTLK